MSSTSGKFLSFITKRKNDCSNNFIPFHGAFFSPLGILCQSLSLQVPAQRAQLAPVVPPRGTVCLLIPSLLGGWHSPCAASLVFPLLSQALAPPGHSSHFCLLCSSLPLRSWGCSNSPLTNYFWKHHCAFLLFPLSDPFSAFPMSKAYQDYIMTMLVSQMAPESLHPPISKHHYIFKK